MDYPISDATADLHNGKFADPDPAQGVLGSFDKARDMNAVYDELRAIIIAGGLTPNEAQYNQVITAINALIANAVSGLRNGVNASLDTLAEIATALNTKSNVGHGHDYVPSAGNAGYANNAGNAATAGYAGSAGNADTVDGYHASQLFRHDQSWGWGDDTNGGFVLPNGRAMQYGLTGAIGDGSALAVNFPAGFGVCNGVYPVPEASGNAHDVSVYGVWSGGFSLRHYDNSGGAASAVRWFALGRMW